VSILVWPLVSLPRRSAVPESKIEKNVSLDHTRPCIQTYNKKIKRYPRINSTVKVIRACIFIMLSVREVTQRVPPTCTIKAVPMHPPPPSRHSRPLSTHGIPPPRDPAAYTYTSKQTLDHSNTIQTPNTQDIQTPKDMHQCTNAPMHQWTNAA
jgi:hypothetical protein